MNKIKHISIIFLLILAFVPGSIYSAPPTQAELETPTGAGTSKEDPLVKCGTGPVDPSTGMESNPCDEDDINILIQAVMNLIFIFTGFIVAGMFMYAGFLMITAQGNASQIQKAKDVFRRVVIGFLIMFLSYIIVKNLLTNIRAQDFFIKLFK